METSNQQNSGSYLDISPENGESKGALIGAIIVILILVIGGVYVLSSKSGWEGLENETATTTDEVVVEETLATSSAISDIETDLQTETDSIDKDLEKLDKGAGL
jgi:hypothetical protein